MSGNQEKKENQNMEQPPVIRLDRQLKYQGNILKIMRMWFLLMGIRLTGISSTMMGRPQFCL